MIVPEEPEDNPQINIVPMIDVIFAILTFFIMATLFLTRSEALPVNLPRAETSQSQQQTKITVTINNQGEISLNRDPIEVSELADEVKLLMGSDAKALVVINADEAVEYGRVIAVMDQLRTVEGATLGMATRRPQS